MGNALASPAGKAKGESITSLRSLLQRSMATGGDGEPQINVRLLIDGSDADGIRQYDELLPLAIVRAILDPEILDFFIPIAGNGRTKPPRTKSHWLHTGYIREVLVLDELPQES